MKFNIFIIIVCLANILLGSPSSKSVRGEYEITLPENKTRGTFEFDLRIDNEITFFQKSDLIESLSLFDSQSNFKSMTRELKGIEGVEEDYFIATLSDNRKKLEIEYFLKNKSVKTKSVKTKGDFRIFNNLYYTLQRDLQKGSKDFDKLLIFPENGSSYKASFHFHKTRNPIGKETPYKDIPDFFLHDSSFTKEVNVCEVSLLGIPGKFFPYKFSFIFDDSEEKNFIGYWGGHPDTPNYYLVKNQGEDSVIN